MFTIIVCVCCLPFCVAVDRSDRGGIVLDREGLDSIHGFYHSFGLKKNKFVLFSCVSGCFSDPMSGLRSFLQRHY